MPIILFKEGRARTVTQIRHTVVPSPTPQAVKVKIQLVRIVRLVQVVKEGLPFVQPVYKVANVMLFMEITWSVIFFKRFSLLLCDVTFLTKSYWKCLGRNVSLKSLQKHNYTSTTFHFYCFYQVYCLFFTSGGNLQRKNSSMLFFVFIVNYVNLDE